MDDSKILIIEDDKDIRNGVRIILENEGYVVDEAENGMAGLEKLDASFNLVILDIMMPGLSGIDTCKKIREKSYIPILFLTARSNEIDKLEGLSAGGDDYLVKPFSYMELVARVKALIRRHNVYDKKDVEDRNDKGWVEREEIRVCRDRNEVLINKDQIDLTDKEYQILLLLISDPKKVFSVENIYESVWDEEYIYSSSNTVMVHIKNLRNKINSICGKGKVIKTVWGKGYRFEG